MNSLNPKVLNTLAKQQAELVKSSPDGKYSILIHKIIGVIFYQNEEGDVMDIQADIIGPGKFSVRISPFSK